MDYKIVNPKSTTDKRIDFTYIDASGANIPVAIIAGKDGILKMYSDSPTLISLFVPNVGQIIEVSSFGHPHED